MKSTDKSFVLIAVLVAAVSAAAGFSLWQLKRSGPSGMTESLMILPEPRVVADFRLVDGDDRAFSLENLRGRWSLLFFGFTHCPDVCPSALYDLAQVHRALVERGHSDDHQVVFVSVDPERDTPLRLKQYAGFFDPDFLAVTGSHQQLGPLTQRIGIAYRIEPHDAGSERYGVDHSASIMLLDPQGRLHGVFPAPHDSDRIIHDMTRVLQ